MDIVLLASQVMASLFVGLMVMRFFRPSDGLDAGRLKDQSNISEQNWPRHLQWLYAPLAPFALPASRLARPSDRVRRALWTMGADHRFTDLEFSKMCWSLSLGLTAMGGLTLSLLWLFGIFSSLSWSIVILGVCMLVPLVLPRTKLRDLSAMAYRNIAQAFPSFLDVLALTLESGKNFQSALALAVQRMPEHGPTESLRRQLQEVLRAIRAGQSRQQALQQLADRVDLQEITQFVASMSTAESQGVSVTALLRRQSEQLRTSRSLAAERHAMKLPVKLLAPLALCIFPCTFLVIAFPIAVRLSESGLF